MNSGLDITYTGYDVNNLHATIGTRKFEASADSESAKIIPKNFLDVDPSEKHTHTYMIGSLNLNYGWDDNWSYLEMMLRQALDCTEIGGWVTFLLLHENGGEDQYVTYPIPNLTDLVLKFNFPFNLDYGTVTGVYKLTIRKEPLLLTE